MNVLSSRIALLFFSNSPEQEAKQKLLHQKLSSKNRVQVFRKLSEQTLSVLEKTQLPIITYTESLQKGNSFGERYANAFDTIFKKGYDYIISVGNDCPNLRTADIEEAISVVQSNGFVAGPSKDGGVYLLGFSKNQFHKAFFEKIRWTTNQVQNDLQTYCTHQVIAYTVLKTKVDLDTWEDLSKYASHFPIYLFKFLISFFIGFRSKRIQFIHKPILFSSFQSLRAPPQFACS